MPEIDERPQSLNELLELLHPRGVYSVALLEQELPRFGFRYDRGADRLAYRDRVELVGSRPAEDFHREAEEDEDLEMDDDKPRDGMLMDAVVLSDVLFRLPYPGRTAPGRLHADRDDAYAANVAAIRAGLVTAPWVWFGFAPRHASTDEPQPVH